LEAIFPQSSSPSCEIDHWLYLKRCPEKLIAFHLEDQNWNVFFNYRVACSISYKHVARVEDHDICQKVFQDFSSPKFLIFVHFFAGLSEPVGPHPPQFLSDQLRSTLGRGADYAHHITTCSQIFRPSYGPASSSADKFLKFRFPNPVLPAQLRCAAHHLPRRFLHSAV
jgi:hypothetical protein